MGINNADGNTGTIDAPKSDVKPERIKRPKMTDAQKDLRKQAQWTLHHLADGVRKGGYTSKTFDLIRAMARVKFGDDTKAKAGEYGAEQIAEWMDPKPREDGAQDLHGFTGEFTDAVNAWEAAHPLYELPAKYDPKAESTNVNKAGRALTWKECAQHNKTIKATLEAMRLFDTKEEYKTIAKAIRTIQDACTEHGAATSWTVHVMQLDLGYTLDGVILSVLGVKIGNGKIAAALR